MALTKLFRLQVQVHLQLKRNTQSHSKNKCATNYQLLWVSSKWFVKSIVLELLQTEGDHELINFTTNASAMLIHVPFGNKKGKPPLKWSGVQLPSAWRSLFWEGDDFHERPMSKPHITAKPFHAIKNLMHNFPHTQCQFYKVTKSAIHSTLQTPTFTSWNMKHEAYCLSFLLLSQRPIWTIGVILPL